MGGIPSNLKAENLVLQATLSAFQTAKYLVRASDEDVLAKGGG